MRKLKDAIIGTVATAMLISLFILVAEIVARITPATWTLSNIASVTSGLLGLTILGANWD